MSHAITKISGRIFALALLVTSLFTLTGCADENDFYGPSIIGGWQLVSTNTGYNEFTFYPDGSGSYYVDDYYGEDYYYIDWETWGNQLNIYFPTETWQFSWSIRNGYLYLYPYGGGEPWVYQRY